MLKFQTHPFVATAVVIFAAAIWGLFWIPLRFFEAHGLDAAWATVAQFVVPALLLLPVALWRVAHRQPIGLNHYSTGLLIGAAFVLYYESLLLTDVVRALLLFYITPIWSTILEVVFLRRRVRLPRLFALLLGISGLFIVLGGRSGIPLPQNPGDMMALLSGIVFAFGSLRVRSRPQLETFEHVFSFFIYGALFAGAMTLLPISELGTFPAISTWMRLSPWLLIMAVFFLIPVMWGLLWGARHLDPGRLGILLQMEAVIGIGSAAILTDEPFGLPEILGTILILGASVVDVLGSDNSALPEVQNDSEIG